MQEAYACSRAVILTGAAGVLGGAMALALLRAGHRVMLSDLTEEPLLRLVEKSGAQRDEVAVCAVDLTSASGSETLSRAAMAAFGRVDMLVNNAAFTAFAAWPDDSKRPNAWEMDVRLVRDFFEINVIAQHALTSRVLPGMIERRWGRIVNITCSYDTMQRIFPYGATKAALEAYTAALQIQLAGTGVTANTLNPGGPVASPVHVAKNPGRKWVEADVMNAPLLWLATNESNDVGGRRYVGAPWDMSLPSNVALERASGPMAWRGFGSEALK